MRFNRKLATKMGGFVMAAMIALTGGLMWATPASAQSDTLEATTERITIQQVREEVQQAGLEAAAELLGMTPDELEDALWGGKTLADLAEEANVPLSDLRTAVEEATQAARQAAVREVLAQLVENGRITQARADWILEGMENGWFGMGRFADRFDGFGREGFRLGQGRFIDRLQDGE